MKKSELVAGLERLPDLDCVIADCSEELLPVPVVVWMSPHANVVIPTEHVDPGTPKPPALPGVPQTVRELEEKGWRRVIVIGCRLRHS